MRSLVAALAIVPGLALASIAMDPHSSLPKVDSYQSNYGAGLSFQSGPFSTTAGNELLVVCATMSYRSNPVVTSTSGLSWTLANGNDRSSVWVAWAPDKLTNERVTVTTGPGSNYGFSGMAIVALSGASKTIGSTAGIVSQYGVGGPTAITTTGAQGSWIFDCAIASGSTPPVSGSQGTVVAKTAVTPYQILYSMGLLRYPSAVSAGTYTVQDGGLPAYWTTSVVEVKAIATAATPTASPAAGQYSQPISVSLSCAAPSPVIRYTTDGTSPTPSSQVYTSPIPISAPGSTIVRAICQSADYLDSAPSSDSYALNLVAATPSASPAPGTYNTAQYVALTCLSPNATIRYTLDGTTPTGASALYTGPFQMNASATVRAMCQSPGYTDSPVASLAYVIVACPAGQACDDGNPCTYNDTCSAQGQCVGTPITCASDACTQRTCNGSATCQVSYATAGARCDDGNACTYDDQCDGFGSCGGSPVTCTAAGPCQQVQCNGTSWCAVTSRPAGASCSSGQSVCGGDVCDGVSPYCQPAE